MLDDKRPWTIFDWIRAVVGVTLMLILLASLVRCAPPPEPDEATKRAMAHGPGYAPAYPPATPNRPEADPNQVVEEPK